MHFKLGNIPLSGFLSSDIFSPRVRRYLAVCCLCAFFNIKRNLLDKRNLFVDKWRI